MAAVLTGGGSGQRGQSLDSPGGGLHATIRTHVARHPPHPRLELRRPRLRLRLRRGEGEHLRAGGHLRDRQRRAFALVRARRHLHPGRQRRHPDQPQQRLLLPAHQGQGHDRGPARAGAAARPAARDQGGACAATWPATTAGCATRASTTSTDPRCQGAPWVRPITEMDAYQRFYQLGLIASQGVAIDGIGGAQPPAGAGPTPPDRRRAGADDRPARRAAAARRDRLERLRARP